MVYNEICKMQSVIHHQYFKTEFHKTDLLKMLLSMSISADFIKIFKKYGEEIYGTYSLSSYLELCSKYTKKNSWLVVFAISKSDCFQK